MKYFVIIFFCCFYFTAHAQLSSHQSSLLNYVERMAQKGKLDLHDFVKPLDRMDVYNALMQLKIDTSLSLIERKELDFFLKGFILENNHYPSKGIVLPSAPLFVKDITNTVNSVVKHRPIAALHQQNLFLYKDKELSWVVNPVMELTQEMKNGKWNNIQAIGLQLMGYAGKKIGFQFSFRDINEKGRFDSVRQENELPGLIVKQTPRNTILNYTEMNATMSLRLKHAIVKVGQDQHVLGYGQIGNIVLSNKAPAYPFYSVQYQPTAWLQFNYMHAWLQSGVLNPKASYPLSNSIYGGSRQQYLPKYYAIHSISVKPTKGLTLNFGESMVYSDQLELAYMLPISFFKAFDNQKYADNILAGSNGQFFAGFSSRNQLPNTHIYGQLMVDEIRMSALLNAGKSRNQIGYQLGISNTDLLLPYLNLDLEYTRINPFMYRNFIAAQNYSNANYALGDWIGANADRWWMGLKYHPQSQFYVNAFIMLLRKNGEGSLEDQYFAIPSPKFGFDPQYNRTKLGFKLQYELWNHVQMYLNCSNTYQSNKGIAAKPFSEASIGICWSKF